MEHSEHPTQLAVQEESSKAAKAKTGAAADYFKRYEKGREGQEGADEADMQYWLSEDEEESHQLKRQQWKSRRGKEPYVVRGAKGPKLRPAEGDLSQKLIDMMTYTVTQTC